MLNLSGLQNFTPIQPFCSLYPWFKAKKAVPFLIEVSLFGTFENPHGNT
jgi:hypothetical protein